MDTDCGVRVRLDLQKTFLFSTVRLIVNVYITVV